MKVSIVMPVYNGEKYIEFAIKSIINQTYNNIQFILAHLISNLGKGMINFPPLFLYSEFFIKYSL